MSIRPENELMQIDEVIKSLRYSKASIYRLMGEGKFPKSIHKLVSKH
jgi:predicted DNA-binding transcriptional regulator AlpA